MVTGNLISLVAAFFTVASSWSKDRKRIFLYQAMQCFLLAIANIFFLSVSGTTTYALCALRNLFIAYDRFTNMEVHRMKNFAAIFIPFGVL